MLQWGEIPVLMRGRKSENEGAGDVSSQGSYRLAGAGYGEFEKAESRADVAGAEAVVGLTE